jgi:uncharacterized membrane protein YgaE (UPF0421/DUF939 family)
MWASRSPTLLFALKSALAAGISWEIADLLLGDEAAALAMISSVIVVQVTSWQTARRGVERLGGILIGVALAFVVARFFGLNIWTITLIILAAQVIGMFFQRRGPYLATQIPISAALALVLGATATEYSLLRLLGALVGGVVGTAISLLISPPIYIFRARDAVADLMTQVAALIPRLADALAGHLSEADTRETYTTIRALEQRVRATEQAYTLGVDSARLNPWAMRARQMLEDYPDVLLALDRLARQMRRIAFTLNEPEASWGEIVRSQAWADDYARVLREVGEILVTTAESMRASPQNNAQPAASAMLARIEDTQRQFGVWQADLARDALPPDASATTSGRVLMLRGTILTDLRRMIEEAQDIVELAARPVPHRIE